MIKKMEDWTFTEHQSYAKGFLNGIFTGLIIALNGLTIGYILYELVNYNGR